MPYYLVAAGGSLYKMTTAGVATALTLPSGVTISSSRRARMAALGRMVCVVNGPNRSIFVDPDDAVRPMILRPPTSAPTLAASTSGGYTGTVRAKYTFITKDPLSGALLAESDFSPISASVTAAAKYITYNVQISPDSACTHRRIYRTATGPGTAYFQCFDVDGNTTTQALDDRSDTSLALLAAPTGLGVAPGMTPGTFMTLIAEWKRHIWGVGDIDPDTLVYSDTDSIYAWPSANSFPIAPKGFDVNGITGLMPRRDELGVAKRGIIWKIVGKDTDTFEPVKVIEGKGCWAPDSVCIIRDVAYFLGEDGVYTWGPDGVQSISDAKARGWFQSDTYFNRAQFPNAVGKYNAKYHGYELHLSAAASSNLDRWVFYDIAAKTWWGPHKTDNFTPTFGAAIIDSDGLALPVIGSSDGYLYKQNQSAFTDRTSAIALDMITPFHSHKTPDIQKLFGELSILSKIQAAAGNLAIAVKVGGLSASVAKTFTADQRLGRERFRVMGPGRLCNLAFTETTDAQGCEIYGYEFPVHDLGRQ